MFWVKSELRKRDQEVHDCYLGTSEHQGALQPALPCSPQPLVSSQRLHSANVSSYFTSGKTDVQGTKAAGPGPPDSKVAETDAGWPNLTLYHLASQKVSK